MGSPATVLNFGLCNQTTVLNLKLVSQTTALNFGFGSRTAVLNFDLVSRTIVFIFGLGSSTTILNFRFGDRTTVLNLGLGSRTNFGTWSSGPPPSPFYVSIEHFGKFGILLGPPPTFWDNVPYFCFFLFLKASLTSAACNLLLIGVLKCTGIQLP